MNRSRGVQVLRSDFPLAVEHLRPLSLHGLPHASTLSFVNIRISYCPICWGYCNRAAEFAAVLRERLGARVEVVEGSLGQFDVQVEGELIWSRGESVMARMKSPRFPDVAKVLATIAAHFPTEEGNLERSDIGRNRRGFGPGDAEKFYDRFGSKQDLQFYERAAHGLLVAHADFEQASAVFEWGCGTGRLAQSLLKRNLAEDARYFGIDISATMIGIAERRLAGWGERASVRKADGTIRLPVADATFDRFLATYVLDLLPEAAIASVIVEAHRVLDRKGKLCVVTSTEGVNIIPRLVTSLWKRVYAFSPRLVGGCRPLRVSRFLDASRWRVEFDKDISSCGISSEILIATRV